MTIVEACSNTFFPHINFLQLTPDDKKWKILGKGMILGVVALVDLIMSHILYFLAKPFDFFLCTCFHQKVIVPLEKYRKNSKEACLNLYRTISFLFTHNFTPLKTSKIPKVEKKLSPSSPFSKLETSPSNAVIPIILATTTITSLQTLVCSPMIHYALPHKNAWECSIPTAIAVGILYSFSIHFSLHAKERNLASKAGILSGSMLGGIIGVSTYSFLATFFNA